MLTVALVFGGRTAEHDVSLASARSVAAKLDPKKYELVPVGITRKGRWVTPLNLEAAFTEGLEATPSVGVQLVSDPSRPGLQRADGVFQPLHLAFPVVHGTFGEDGTLQALFEFAGLPYVGAGVAASAIGMDKEHMKDVFAAHGLPQVDYLVLRDSATTGPAAVAAVEARLPYPVFVKPVNAGSSMGMTKAHDRAELEAALVLAASYDRKVIVEEACDGRELECAVLGNEEVRVTLAGEITHTNEYFDYEAKYTTGKLELTVPAPISAEKQEEIMALAEVVYRAIDCCGYARCDFFMERSTGRLLVNEINTIPGMTDLSVFPELWAGMGLTGAALIDEMIELGLSRATFRNRLVI